MQMYINSAAEIHRATSAHIALIHHSPWNSDRGKGAIDLDGAIDGSFEVTVKGTGPHTLSGPGANDDADEGSIMSFRLEGIEVGRDAKGKPTMARWWLVSMLCLTST
jgi:hypothetical protein